MVDSIKKRLPAREVPEAVAERRRRFAAATPVVEFDSVAVTIRHAAKRLNICGFCLKGIDGKIGKR